MEHISIIIIAIIMLCGVCNVYSSLNDICCEDDDGNIED